MRQEIRTVVRYWVLFGFFSKTAVLRPAKPVEGSSSLSWELGLSVPGARLGVSPGGSPSVAVEELKLLQPNQVVFLRTSYNNR